MPHLHLPITPERVISSLRRSDSKDPSTTCRGLTTAGRHCRNPLKVSLASSVATQQGGTRTLKVNDEAQNGVVTTGDNGEVVFYCWRHKDQATSEIEAGGKPRQEKKEIVKLEGRTSVDTLIERLGGLGFDEKQHGRRRNDVEAEWRIRERYRQQTRNEKSPQRSFWASLCCMSSPELKSGLAVRPRPAPTRSKRSSLAPATPRRTHAPSFGNRPTVAASPSSQTQTLLSYIPTSLSPQTASALLAELAKPLSGKDEEGYIYIFWLQSEADQRAKSVENADPALLSLLQTRQATRGHRTSEIVRQASVAKPRNGTGVPKILLKIGRANNVHRRMHEWARQCGYTPSLIRWYPYVPSSSPIQISPSPVGSPHSPNSPKSSKSVPGSPSTGTTAKKVPHAHKVERLIHIELNGQRVMHRCETCGKEHREWFEIEATRKDVKMVDGVVRRWVAWAERER